jgi:uncharacterized protein
VTLIKSGNSQYPIILIFSIRSIHYLVLVLTAIVESSSDETRADFSYVLRRKVQVVMSKFAFRSGLRKFDPSDFKLEQIHLAIPGLPDAFENYRIVHISDIHFGQWVSSDRLEGAVNLINEVEPDVVAITGDFVSYLLDDSVEEMSQQLRRLKPKDVTVAVLGNHDHWSGAEGVCRILRKSNICDISNNIYVVRKGASKLNFAGVDSAMVKKDRLDLVLEKMPSDGPAILLVHEPDFAVKSSATKRFSLQLSGHSHGGQFIIPGIGTPIRGHLFMKYPLGKHMVDGMIEYTNRGLGTNGFWLRINCPPEITVISLI